MSSRLKQFADVYWNARVEDQRAYYRKAAEKHERAHRQLLVLTSVAFGLTSTVGLIAGLSVPGKRAWAVVAAVLPALTTMLAAYGGLYSFERIAKLYRDALGNLAPFARPKLPEGEDGQAAVTKYVSHIEHVFERERSQWGQTIESSASQATDSGDGHAAEGT